VPQVLALEQLHHEVRQAAACVDARGDDLDHVLARDARAHTRLLLEALLQARVGHDLAVHDLERPLLAGALLVDPVHQTHPALVERPHDREVAADDRPGGKERLDRHLPGRIAAKRGTTSPPGAAAALPTRSAALGAWSSALRTRPSSVRPRALEG
jgi:hypothetical protein